MLLLVGCALAVGCGGHGSGNGKHGVTPRTSRAEQRRVHEANNLAYLEIARASGALRANTAAAALGRVPRITDRPAIAAAETTLLQIHPHDSDLVVARTRMQAALKAALAAHGDRRSQRAAAIAALRATDAINKQLQAYAARNPDVQSLVPD